MTDECKKILKDLDMIHAGDEMPDGEFQVVCRIGSYRELDGNIYVEGFVDDKELVLLETPNDMDNDKKYIMGSNMHVICEKAAESIYKIKDNLKLREAEILIVKDGEQIPYQYVFKP